MIGTIFYIALIFGLIFFIFVKIRLFMDKTMLISAFQRNNVNVSGKKGTGKDLIFDYVINTRKRPCASNLQYNSKYCKVKQIKDYLLVNNGTNIQLDYDSLINDKFDKFKKTFIEDEDYYISDAGVYLASQYHGQLDRDYKSLPIVYALSRHLAHFNIHTNSQNLMRVWDKLREQADTYIVCVRTRKFLGSLFTKAIYYDKYESAKAGLLPFKGAIFKSSERKARQVEYDAQNGLIRTLWIRTKIKDITYDTRAFHEVLYGYKYKAIPTPIYIGGLIGLLRGLRR